MTTWEEVYDRLVAVGSVALSVQRAEIIAKGIEETPRPPPKLVREWHTTSLRGERVVHTVQQGSLLPANFMRNPHSPTFMPATDDAAREPCWHPLRTEFEANERLAEELAANGQAEDGAEIETDKAGAEQTEGAESRSAGWFGLW